MSIGGNDVGFVNLLDHCVYRFYDPFCNGCGFFNPDCSSDCDGVIQDTQSKIDNDLSDGLDSAIKAIFQNAPSTHLYLTLYPQFFNPDTTQCNGVQFNVGCAGSVGGFFSPRRSILPVTQDRRNKMNTLTNNLNNQIKAAVGRAQPGNGGSINWVDTNPFFDGHRFCEQPNTEPSYRNSEIYFYPYEFYTGGTLSYVQSFDNSTNCSSILDDPDNGDWGDYLACELAEAIHTSPNATSQPIPGFLQANNNISAAGADQGDGVSTDSSDSLPDFLARIFHPNINGMSAYKSAIITQYQQAAAQTPTPTPTPTPTSTNYCNGNQITGSCVAGKVPAPTGGLGCIRPKEFGGSSDALLYNTQSATNAIATYCSNLVSSKTVLNSGNTNVNPGIVPGAEDGGNIALDVLYDGDYCLNTETPNEIDFGQMGQEGCEQAFGGINTACGEDPTWSGYNADNSGFGGVAGQLCGLWSVYGQPAS